MPFKLINETLLRTPAATAAREPPSGDDIRRKSCKHYSTVKCFICTSQLVRNLGSARMVGRDTAPPGHRGLRVLLNSGSLVMLRFELITIWSVAQYLKHWLTTCQNTVFSSPIKWEIGQLAYEPGMICTGILKSLILTDWSKSQSGAETVYTCQPFIIHCCTWRCLYMSHGHDDSSMFFRFFSLIPLVYVLREKMCKNTSQPWK